MEPEDMATGAGGVAQHQLPSAGHYHQPRARQVSYHGCSLCSAQLVLHGLQLSAIKTACTVGELPLCSTNETKLCSD